MDAHPDWVKSNDEWGWKELKARYWGLCTLVDKYIGKILDQLDDLGLAKSTVVVHTSDHGHMMGEHRLLNKGVHYDPSSRIPLLVRDPGLPPQHLTTPVGHVDLVPTLLDLLHQPVPKHVQGTSLAPLLEEGDVAGNQGQAIIEWNGDRLGDFELGPADARTIRCGKWKLSMNTTGEHQLYNLESDPEEYHNAYPELKDESLVADLAERLIQWQHQTADSLELPGL